MMRLVTVGTNFVTERLLAEIKTAEDVSVVGIHSRSAQRARELCEKYGVPTPYTSYEDVAADPGVDAVYLAVPTSLHASLSELFLRAEKAVLCEKPSASNVRELTHVLKTARENGVLWMEAYMTPFLPNYAVLRSAVSRLGRIRGAEFRFEKRSSRYDAFLRGENVNTFLPAFSNGAVMDLGIYTVYPALDLFGLPRDVAAKAVLASTGVDLHGSAVLSYDGFSVRLSYAKDRDDERLSQITGDRGTVLFDRISEPTTVLFTHPDGTTEDLSVKQENVMAYEVCHFADLWKNGRTESDVNTFEKTKNALLLCDEIRRQTGVVFPADTEN